MAEYFLGKTGVCDKIVSMDRVSKDRLARLRGKERGNGEFWFSLATILFISISSLLGFLRIGEISDAICQRAFL